MHFILFYRNFAIISISSLVKNILSDYLITDTEGWLSISLEYLTSNKSTHIYYIVESSSSRRLHGGCLGRKSFILML